MAFSRSARAARIFRQPRMRFVVALHENSTPQPSVYFNSGNVIFTAAPVGTQNAPQPVAVHNGGEAALTISSLQITGPNASDFSLIGPGACNGATIPVGGECSFEVGFVPSTTGAETAVVSLTDNAPGNPQGARADRRRARAAYLAFDAPRLLLVLSQKTRQPKPSNHCHKRRQSGAHDAESSRIRAGCGAVFPEWQGHHLRPEPRRQTQAARLEWCSRPKRSERFTHK